VPVQPVAPSRLIVCDCLTLFVAVVGASAGPAAKLLLLFLDGVGEYTGMTTPDELVRARQIVHDHASVRPERFPAAAARWANHKFDLLESSDFRHFEVRQHPTISMIPAAQQDDHLFLLSAAVAWGAEFFSTYNTDLRRMRAFGSVRIGNPEHILSAIGCE